MREIKRSWGYLFYCGVSYYIQPQMFESEVQETSSIIVIRDFT